MIAAKTNAALKSFMLSRGVREESLGGGGGGGMEGRLNVTSSCVRSSGGRWEGEERRFVVELLYNSCVLEFRLSTSPMSLFWFSDAEPMSPSNHKLGKTFSSRIPTLLSLALEATHTHTHTPSLRLDGLQWYEIFLKRSLLPKNLIHSPIFTAICGSPGGT